MAWPILPKQDDPQRLLQLNGVPIKFWLSAGEINEIIKRLSALLGEETSLYKGEFDYLAEIEAEHPLPEPGSYAHLRVIAGDDIFCRWDNTTKKWIQDGLVKDQEPVVIGTAENIRAVLEATGTKYYGTKDGVAGVWAFPEGTGGGTPVETVEGFKVFNFSNGYQGGLTWKPFSNFEFDGNSFSTTTTLTPTTADIPAGEQKFAAIVLNSNGTITLVEAQPAVNPSAPNIDPATQYIPDGGLILLSSGAATPEGVSLQKIYTNNSGIAGGEWDATISRGGARWDLASNEGEDGVCIKGTNLLADDMIQLTAEESIPVANFTELTFKIKNLVNTGLPAGSSGGFRFVANGNYIHSNGQIRTNSVLLPSFDTGGYDVTNTQDWQYISLKMPAFRFISINYLGFVFDHADPAVVPTILLDDIKYNDGSAPSGENFATVGYVERLHNEQKLDLDNKVDKIAGKGLSTEDYTTSEKTKLSALELFHKGIHTDITALRAAYPEGAGQTWHKGIGGWTGDVDAGAGADNVRYLWDASDLKWVIQQGATSAETAESIKSKLLQNPDTFTVTQAILDKINSITAIFTTTLKASYDTAASWVSTNGQNVVDHLTKWVTPTVAGKIPVSQADGSIVWQDKTPNKFLGTYTSLANLEAAYPAANAGEHADVDAGVGTDVKRYIWDADDNKWVTGGTGGTIDTSNLAKLDSTNNFSQPQNFVKLNIEDLGVSNPRTTRIKLSGSSTFSGWFSKLIFGVTSNGANYDMLELEGGNNSFGNSKIKLNANKTTVTQTLEVLGALTGLPKIDLTRNSHDVLSFSTFGKMSGSIYTENSNPQNLVFESVMNGGTGWSSGIRFRLRGGDGTMSLPLELRSNGYGDSWIQANSRIILSSQGIDLSNLIEAADDAAAGAAGVAVGRGYINSATGALHKRRS